MGRLTDIGSLDHADVIPAISDAADGLLGEGPDETRNIRFLGRRTATSDHGRELGGENDEFVAEAIQAELRTVNLCRKERKRSANLE